MIRIFFKAAKRCGRLDSTCHLCKLRKRAGGTPTQKMSQAVIDQAARDLVFVNGPKEKVFSERIRLDVTLLTETLSAT
jgi:hypothetical protein